MMDTEVTSSIHILLGTFPFTSFTVIAIKTQEMFTYAVIIFGSKCKQIHDVTTSFHLWCMLHYHQKKKKNGLDPGVRSALENSFSSQVQNYLYSTELVTDMHYQHTVLFLPTPPCLDTGMTTL